MLTVTEVSFAYSGNPVLADVNLTINPGEWVGLRGASGSGKSTLGRIVAGYLRPASGSVAVDGLPPTATTPRSVQLVSQNPLAAVNPRWRLADVLRERIAVAQAPAVLDSLGVRREWLSRWPHEVSGGELQRIVIARALLANPRYLVADEVTVSLDPVSQAEVWRSLRRYCCERRIGVLVISHKAALLDKLCDRILGLSPHGRKTSRVVELAGRSAR